MLYGQAGSYQRPEAPCRSACPTLLHSGCSALQSGLP
jgi:hypothetical protein